MKTKEEIEDIVNKEYGEYAGYHKASFTNGYTKCQEDMADTIKQAIEYGYQLRCNNKPINSGIDWVKEFNSLNKQY